MKAATAANQRVNVDECNLLPDDNPSVALTYSLDCHPDGAANVLALLDPIVSEQIELTKQVEVLQALKVGS